jgi:tetratricopeptide (TPR) repeat protein
MKGILKFLLIAGVITAVIVVVTNKTRRRATAPVGAPTGWEPPTVTPTAPAPAEPEPEVSAAEAEGMTTTDAHPEDFARSADGTPVTSELAATPLADFAPETAAEPEPGDLAVAQDEGMTVTDAHPEDFARGADGTPVTSELAATPMADFAPETAEPEPEALAVAEDEGMAPPPEAPAEDVPISSEGEPLVSELAAIPLAELPAEIETLETPEPAGHDALPDFDAMLQDAVAETEAAVESGAAVPALEEESKDPDFLAKYFEDLANTPEETPEAITGAAAGVASQGGDEALLTSVQEALDDLEPAPIVPPPRRTAESYLDEGNVYFNVGQYGLAIERYGQALEMDSDLTAAYYNRANAHTRAGDFEKALADYDQALRLQPRDADALNNRGMLHLYRANYAAALEDFNGALEADPTDTTVMVNRGLAHLHGGNAAAALVDFREAANVDASDAAAQYGAAQASASLGNRDEALKHVTRALELDPGYAREAAADPRLALLQGDDDFLRLLRESGSRSN